MKKRDAKFRQDIIALALDPKTDSVVKLLIVIYLQMKRYE
jgi:hypothetical protein